MAEIPPERINWGLHQAVRAAQRSRHERTQVGAAVLAPDGRWASGCNDDDLHAEVACLADAAAHGVPTAGATMCCTWAACPACAKAIVAAGVERVVMLRDWNYDTPKRWREAVKAGVVSLVERGVMVEHGRLWPVESEHVPGFAQFDPGRPRRELNIWMDGEQVHFG